MRNLLDTFSEYSILFFDRQRVPFSTLFKIFFEYHLHYLDRQSRRIAGCQWWISSVNRTPVPRKWKTPCQTQYIRQVFFWTLCIKPHNLCHLPRPLPTTRVTQYRRVGSENPDDILNFFGISYHKDCIIFNSMRDVQDSYSSTAFAECQRVPYSTPSARSFPSTIYITLTVSVDV